MTVEIVGRENEVAALHAFFDRAGPGGGEEPAALVLEGEAGIGKTTLWLAGLEAARERGLRVLTARTAEAEQQLALAGLADLLDGVIEEVLPELSRPQRRALDVALLIEDADDDASDPRALGVALRSALRFLARDVPLVIAIDDVQWLDPSSANALEFAVRRLEGSNVSLLLARRGDGSSLELALADGRAELLPICPLSIGAIHRMLQRRVGRPFARPTLHRLHEISGGNPFYALELARGLPLETAGNPTIPVPETLERLVGARLAGLGSATREALLLTAAHGRPTPALLDAAGIGANALKSALAAHAVELSDAVIRFTHPLLASVLYQGAPEEERRKAHERLAAIVEDPVERARHLALASDTPDEDVAAALEDAANLARRRGTVIAVAELAEHALRLTPSDALEARHRRTIAAARAHVEARDAGRARTLALELLAGTRANGRAEALVLLSDIESARAHLEHAIDLRREALEAAAGLPVLELEIHQWLSGEVVLTEGAAAGDEHAMIAVERAEALDNDSLRSWAVVGLAFGRFRAGVPGALSLLEQAAQLETLVDPHQGRRVSFSVVHALVCSYQLEHARTLLESIDREWSGRDELTAAEVLYWQGLIEFRSGLFAVAADLAERCREIWREYTIDEPEDPRGVWLVALIAAHRGELEYARALAELNRALTERLPAVRSGDDAVLGLVELWSGHPRAAAARFAAAEADRLGSGVNEPSMFWWRAGYAEALLALGRIDGAAALVDTWEAQAALLGREAVLAEATRCRGLIAAARGETKAALAELARAVLQHEAVGDLFGRARALLALGVTRRRARQKRAAREAIEAALDGFETCGAAGWAEKARAELGSIGGRTRENGLTPAERRVAALVAEGRTNREAAAALFLGERTVETHLSHVYAKLGIRSRTELARTL